MQQKKIFILLPDGIGLRNFAFTNFHKLGLEKGFDITFWNNTPFELGKLGIKEIPIKYAKPHPITSLLKVAQTQIELSQNIKKSGDRVYDSYRFPLKNKSLKDRLKNILIKCIILANNSKNGLKKIRSKVAENERKTKFYFDSLETLEKEKPAMVFCTNQRMLLAVAPILAAQDLGIPTATFIFSWDNLPKGTKIVETDFYFVWSEHMKKELQYYYPHIVESQIIITGTPQFESHFDNSLISREDFCREYDLDLNKKYICFSGDDVTTSPNDPTYLEDLAKSVTALNEKGLNLGIIFRRCPVDFSNRYDPVLEKYQDLIKSINPKWEMKTDSWQAILPTKGDLILQMNTIYHSELVINLGSSMVFDFATFGKPCAFINYDVPNVDFPDWSVKKIYNFIHFRSMPSKDAVFWINDPNEFGKIVEKMLGRESENVVQNARDWFEKINQHPPQLASERIWNAINEICKEPC
ncbi:UDP-glycosyltransferase [Flavobacterium wongokense]|uniref:UDP-glycosyltransferase n=1 Tax=Flavobacterium wongokense TaxID=2910674 RepID=UPI001F29C7A8|nr:UDP-glycosyltransferase [Flavobacterium sp. WG47]MCF6132668.1 UDP-glycosyltransferase [Flavobacterium sp. WG47]